MGKIVAAFGTVHAPQLFVRPPSEDLAQLDADVAAMRLLGKDLLRLRMKRDTPSYWIERQPPGPKPDTFPNQF